MDKLIKDNALTKILLNKKNLKDKVESETLEEIKKILEIPEEQWDNLTWEQIIIIAEEQRNYIKKLEEENEKLKKEEKKEFYKLREQKHTNQLHKNLGLKMNTITIDLVGNGNLEQKDFRIKIKGFNELEKSRTANKTLDIFIITATEKGQNSPIIEITLKEFMEIRGLKDEKSARAQIKRDINILDNIELEWTDNRGSWLKANIGSGETRGIYNGIIRYQFTEAFFNSLPANQFMYLPKESFKINDNNNPNSYNFIRTISEHKRMNIGKANENIISVKTLLNSSPNIKKYEDLNQEKQVNQLIIEPFERDLSNFKCIKWEYILDSEQNPPETYQKFIEAKIKIIWDNYPETTYVPEKKPNNMKKKPSKRINKNTLVDGKLGG